MSVPTFRRFLIVRNPVSTNARLADRRISELKQAFPEIECLVVETLPGGREANVELLRPLADKLGGRTLLCVAGGDGTNNMVLEILLTDPTLTARARRTPLLPLWGGNANDLAHMLNGRGRPADLPSLVRAGVIAEVFPLACAMTDATGETTTHLAACYASFGASAITTQILSAAAVRARVALSRLPLLRFMWELLIVIPAMSQAPTFLASENGRHKTVYEYIFFNGSRFAKVNGVKRRLTDQSFHRAVVERKRLSDITLSVVALTRRKQANKLESTRATFTALEATWSQFDGEANVVYAGTRVVITIAKQPFYALSTRLVNDGDPTARANSKRNE